jgi:hypothetical protein
LKPINMVLENWVRVYEPYKKLATIGIHHYIPNAEGDTYQTQISEAALLRLID